MATIRQQKMARVVKEAVSDIISNHLQDPRVAGFITVTGVDVSADMKKADVFLSIMGLSDSKQRAAFEAVNHAAGHIQSLLGGMIKSRFCPHLFFRMDQSFSKTLETLELIERISKDFSQES